MIFFSKIDKTNQINKLKCMEIREVYLHSDDKNYKKACITELCRLFWCIYQEENLNSHIISSWERKYHHWAYTIDERRFEVIDNSGNTTKCKTTRVMADVYNFLHDTQLVHITRCYLPQEDCGYSEGDYYDEIHFYND